MLYFLEDPTWVTETIAGIGIDGRPLVTKMSFRYLHTLNNLGTAPNRILMFYGKLNHHKGLNVFVQKLQFHHRQFNMKMMI